MFFRRSLRIFVQISPSKKNLINGIFHTTYKVKTNTTVERLIHTCLQFQLYNVFSLFLIDTKVATSKIVHFDFIAKDSSQEFGLGLIYIATWWQARVF